jgi:hypothetical protein
VGARAGDDRRDCALLGGREVHAQRSTRSRRHAAVWHDVFDALPDAADWQIGAEVVAQGPVNSFRGDLEIVPEHPVDVSILARAVTEEPATLRLAPLGAITPEDIGRTVFISGTIESIDRFEDGVRFRLGRYRRSGWCRSATSTISLATPTTSGKA